MGSGTRAISSPSISMLPSAGLLIRNMEVRSVLFPDPVRPQIPTRVPASITAETPFKTSGLSRYRTHRLFRRTSPRVGQSFGTSRGLTVTSGLMESW